VRGEGPIPCPLDQSGQAKHHHSDPRKQAHGGRHQIGTPAGFKSESVAGFLSECLAGFVGIRIFVQDYNIPLGASLIEAMHEAIKNSRDPRWISPVSESSSD